MTITLLLLILWFAYWSAESGSSLPWSSKWQNRVDWFSELPEATIALSTAGIATWGWGTLFGLSPLASVLVFLLTAGATYAGKQSATWGYLNWTGHTKDENGDGVITDADGRKSTLFGVNNFIARLFGFKLGDEGYSWVWAATKGAIITAPVGFTGLITFPIGHEIGSHAKGRLPGEPNMWKELISGATIGVSCALFVWCIT